MTTTRPTILQLIPHLDTGGAEITTLELAAAIVKAGGRALVLSEGGRLAGRIREAGGEVLPFPAATKNPARIVANGFRLARIIGRERVSLIHARSRAPAWSALIAARRTGIPLVTTYHGAYSETGKFKKLYNSVMARGDRVIANSNYTAELVKRRYGTPPGIIRVIHRGVDGAIFDPAAIAPQRIADLRAAWGISDDSRIILNAARLTRWKGQRVIIEAAHLLTSEAPELARKTVIILAGDAQGRSDYVAGLELRITELGLAGQVRLVGHVDDIPAAFALAWLGVVASTEPEAFGRAATESQVMGCPVIATAIGAPPETVLTAENAGLSSRTGWLVPPSDAAALARSLAEGLALTATERAEIGARARRHVLDRFSLTAMRANTLAVYDELLGSDLSHRFAAAHMPQSASNG